MPLKGYHFLRAPVRVSLADPTAMDTLYSWQYSVVSSRATEKTTLKYAGHFCNACVHRPYATGDD